MEGIDLNIGVPLLIQDQNETVVYMDSEMETEAESIIFKSEEDETLIVNGTNEAIFINNSNTDEAVVANNIIDNETLIINQENDSETIMTKQGDENIILDDNLLNKNELNIYNEILSSDESDANDTKDINTIVIENVGGEPICLNGQMVQLLDGTTAFIENSKNSENEVYTPIKLYNGNMIYVMAGTLLNTINSSENNSNDSNEKNLDDSSGDSVVKTEKNKGYQCSYKNCNKSYTSFHHLKVK